ncbi:unknown [Prevotella sp. CAG:1092]|nr:unknown [Prevotella sp. CAG:1092]
MIDKHEPFYSRFKQKHPGFRCKHRLFFHWGYNAEPWNPSLGAKVKEYCNRLQSQNKKRRISLNDTIKQFKEEIKCEQKRRNRLINKETENTFGFGHGGKEAKFASFFASFAYNVHLIGDYTSDNTDLEGLQKLENIIGLIVKDLQKIDYVRARDIKKGITNINKRYVGPQKKADVLLKYLKKEVPSFVKEAQNGYIYRRLGKKGFKFRK